MHSFVSSCPSVLSPTTSVNPLSHFFNNSCILSIHLVHISPPPPSVFILFHVSDIYKLDSYKKWEQECIISLHLFPICVQYLSYEIYGSIHTAFTDLNPPNTRRDATHNTKIVHFIRVMQ
jgi:hypothetical protein